MNHRSLLTTFTAVCVSLAIAPFATNGQSDAARNSTKKIRVQPGPVSSKVGTAVNWSSDLDEARKLAKSSGKPIFWYVPTIPGTFMDRKTEIDRYMMAGPFSWPAIIDLLNEEFVPLRVRPSRDQAAEFELKRYDFVEPGFMIVQPDGAVKTAVDQLTTMHPRWLQHLIAVTAGLDKNEKASSDANILESSWQAFAKNQPAELPDVDADDPVFAEAQMLRGMIEFRDKKTDQAIGTWKELAMSHPNHPLAWKAAAEAEGWGPFVRGFEIHADIPDKALEAGVSSRGSAAPAGIYSEEECWERGVQFLLNMQREDGGFVDCDYDFGGTDSLPNVHVAVTSLCGMALLAARDQNRVPSSKQLDDAINKAAAYVSNDKNLNRYDRDEILWAHAYRLRFLCRWNRSGEFEDVGSMAQIHSVVKDLENIQLKTGGWYHEYSNPFVTGTALCALFEAKEISESSDVDMEKIKAGLNALAADRFANGAYPNYSRRSDADRRKNGSIPASAGRALVCELGRYYWDAADQEALIFAVENAFENHNHLASAMKYDNHTDNMAYGGFFIWYDLRIRSEAVAAIEDESRRSELEKKQREIILSMPELDGCFVDSHELGRCYGTAMALLSLSWLK